MARHSMYQLIVSLSIDRSEYLKYYSGAASEVITRSLDGRTVRFPANILRPFVTHDGIHGRFVLRYNQQHKFVDIKKLSN